MDTRIDKTSTVGILQALHYLVVMKRELSKKAKLSIFKTIFALFSPGAPRAERGPGASSNLMELWFLKFKIDGENDAVWSEN